MLLRFMISMTAVLALISCSGAENAEESPVEATTTQEAAAPEAETTPAPEKEPAVDPAAVKAPAEVASKSASTDVSLEEVNCVAGDDKRVISITKPEGKLCSVVYAKFSESNEVAWAVNDASYCTEVKEKIMANLSAAGYSCDGQIANKAATETTPAANETAPATETAAPAANEAAPAANETETAAPTDSETK